MKRMVLTRENIFNKCLESNSDPYNGLLKYRNTSLKYGYSSVPLLMPVNLRIKLPDSEQILKPNSIDFNRYNTCVTRKGAEGKIIL